MLAVALQTPETGRFLKGLAVVNDVAYFGISSVRPRSARHDPALNCDLAAFHLRSNKLLWRKEVRSAILPRMHVSAQSL